MVFSSALFLFLFLPLFLLVYYPLKPKFKLYWILFGSWVFYALWRVDFLFLLVGISLANYLAGRMMENQRVSKRVIIICIVLLNLGVLGYFKYADFGIQALNSLLALVHLPPLQSPRLILPVGISFYIFQGMSYSIDVYRGDARPARDFGRLAAYISLFPQLIAGPILRYKDVEQQLSLPHISPGRSQRGLMRFILGLAKKLLIADALAPLANAGFSLIRPQFADSWLALLAYSLQLYFDFSAYSDMAIGLGLMLGFRFRENFRQPYLSRSITEFWQRWHISLSTWLRDYLYIPLGGNRISPRRTGWNLMIVMLLGGLWHGASWNFVLWGIWHGALLLLERRIGFHRTRSAEIPGERRYFRRLLLRLYTLLAVVIGWALFRASDLSSATGILAGAAGLNGFGVSENMAWQVSASTLLLLPVVVVFAMFEDRFQRWYSKIERSPRYFTVGFMLLLLLLSVFMVLGQSYSPFLYFQF